MSLVMITANLQPDAVAEVDASIDRLFTALEAAAPQGVRYTSMRAPDGVTAVILLELQDDIENPLPAIPEFVQFQQDLRGWIAGPPLTMPLTVKGTYRLF